MFIFTIASGVLGSIIAAWQWPGHALMGAGVGLAVGVCVWLMRAFGLPLGIVGDLAEAASDLTDTNDCDSGGSCDD